MWIIGWRLPSHLAMRRSSHWLTYFSRDSGNAEPYRWAAHEHYTCDILVMPDFPQTYLACLFALPSVTTTGNQCALPLISRNFFRSLLERFPFVSNCPFVWKTFLQHFNMWKFSCCESGFVFFVPKVTRQSFITLEGCANTLLHTNYHSFSKVCASFYNL